MSGEPGPFDDADLHAFARLGRHTGASLGAALAWAGGAGGVAYGLVAGLTLAALLEAVFALCLGCVVFGRLMRWGVIPQSVCLECNDISARLAQRLATNG